MEYVIVRERDMVIRERMVQILKEHDKQIPPPDPNLAYLYQAEAPPILWLQEQTDACCICYETGGFWIQLVCGHYIHDFCATRVIASQYPNCPLCRAVISFSGEDDDDDSQRTMSPDTEDMRPLTLQHLTLQQS